jgi:hypothetical protein
MRCSRPGAYWCGTVTRANTADRSSCSSIIPSIPLPRRQTPDGTRPAKELGIRIGWDDEQVTIWMNRQIDATQAGYDAPIGVQGYRVDVRHPAEATWHSLVHAAGPLTIGGLSLGAFDGELGVETHPVQLRFLPPAVCHANKMDPAREHCIFALWFGVLGRGFGPARQSGGGTGCTTGGIGHSACHRRACGDAELYRLTGSVLLAENKLDEGQASLQQAIRTAQTQRAKSLELRAARDLARLWAEQGQRAEAREACGRTDRLGRRNRRGWVQYSLRGDAGKFRRFCRSGRARAAKTWAL